MKKRKRMVMSDDLLDGDNQADTPVKATSSSRSGRLDKPATRSVTPEFIGLGQKFHDYDAGSKKRKLSKKAQVSLAEWQSELKYRKRDTYFQQQAEVAKHKFGHGSVIRGDELNNLMVGIPLPSLALEWATENNVFPLSQIVIICGKWGSCKSALLYEIFRWFAKFGGGAIHMENETKFSDTLCTSIMGIDVGDPSCPIIVNKCSSVEDWQSRLTFYLKDQKSRMIGTKEEPGPGRTIPVVFSVDSVMGKASEEKHEKIMSHGSAQRGGPVESLKISEYLQAMSHEFDLWPFSLVLVNHLKQKVSIGDSHPSGDSEGSPGGARLQFQESFELRTSVWKSKVDTADFRGIGIRIHCAKNSFGETGRKIRTRMLWWDDPIGEHPKTHQTIYRRRTVWDWDWSTITMLNELPEMEKKRLKEADFHLQVRSPTADVECLANSRTLGMGKDEWEPFHVVGAMIRERQDVMEQLRIALAIKQCALLRGDYLKQLDGKAVKLK